MPSNTTLNHCPSCGSINGHFQYKLDFGNVVQCEKCKLIFTQFMKMETFYSANKIFSDPEQIRANNYMLLERRNEASERLKLLLKFCSPKRGKLLEFGCNTGEFLYMASKVGFKVTGIDHCLEPLSMNKVEGLQFIQADATSVHLPEKYDVVAAFHLFEHLENPRLFLHKVRENLLQGGILFLEVPNYGSRSRMIQGEKWHLFFDYHITHFDLKTLAHLLESCGFSVIYSRTLQPIHYYIDPFYLPFRNWVWNFIKKMNMKKDLTTSTKEEVKIVNSFKAKLLCLEMLIKKIILIPIWPYAKWIEKIGEADILQIIAISNNDLKN